MLASRPAAANPIAVEPNDAIDRNELAAASSSSLAISGMRLSWAGSKNCLTPALISSRTYRPGRAMASMPMTIAMQVDDDRLDEARHRSGSSCGRAGRRRRPPSRPTTRLGMAVTISVRPTARAEPVSR